LHWQLLEDLHFLDNGAIDFIPFDILNCRFDVSLLPFGQRNGDRREHDWRIPTKRDLVSNSETVPRGYDNLTRLLLLQHDQVVLDRFLVQISQTDIGRVSLTIGRASAIEINQYLLDMLAVQTFRVLNEPLIRYL
jgi:hypothetical protein